MDESPHTDIPPGSDVQGHVLVLRLDRHRLALPAEAVVQIIPMVTITPVPQLPTAVAGVINVHGSVVPVVNLGYHLGLASCTCELYTPIILVTLGEHTVGLIVDEVLDVVGLAAGLALPADKMLPEGLREAPVVQGLADVGDGLVVILDPCHLFEPDQAQLLAEAVEVAATGQHQDLPLPKGLT